MRTNQRINKIKEIAGVVFALILVACGVGLWAFITIDTLDDCLARGHTVGWCMSSRHLDTGH